MKEKHHKKEKEPEAEPIEDVEERNDEELADREFVASVIRAPRQGAYEQFLCQLLAQSVICTDPLKRVKIVSEAAWTIKESERKDLAIDYGKIEALNAVANALLNPSIRRLGQNYEVFSVQWGFPETEENFITHILPWYNCRPSYWPDLIRKHIESWRFIYCYWCGGELGRRKLSSPNRIEVPAKCPHCKRDLRYSGLNDRFYTFVKERKYIVDEPRWSFFFELAQCLSQEGYAVLRNTFIAWASPQAQLYLAELTNAVDPNTYRDVLGFYSRPGRRDYAQKVKESAQLTPEAHGENSVD